LPVRGNGSWNDFGIHEQKLVTGAEIGNRAMLQVMLTEAEACPACGCFAEIAASETVTLLN
jgi:hypothetical protein